MFKKPLSNLKTSAPLRSSDRRKLKQRVVQSFAVTDEIGDLLVPEGILSVKFLTHLKEPGTAYLAPNGGDPLWFTIGKDSEELIPTVYTLWKQPALLPWISTPAAVIPKLIGGADLMIPGVVRWSPSLVDNQLVAVVQHNPDPTKQGYPLAVGHMAVNAQELAKDGKGKAVYVKHAWKDILWDMGQGGEVPEPISLYELSGDLSQLQVADTATASGSAEPTPTSSPDDATTTEAESSSGAPELSPEEITDVLRNSLIQAIRSSLSKLTPASFPLAATILYSNHILPSRPAFPSKPSKTPIDIKHSSHKTLTTFLKAMEKDGLISLKVFKGKGSGEVSLMAVNTLHPDVQAHKLYASIADIEAKKEKKEEREEAEKNRVKELIVIEKYKPLGSPITQFFDECGASTTALFTATEVRSLIAKYIQEKQLVNPREQQYINLDATLRNAVQGKGDADTEFLKRDEIIRNIIAKMQDWYEITPDGKDPVLKKGSIKPISVTVKVRQGRKASTLVTGFEPFLLVAEDLADELRKVCASSTAVSPIPGKSSGQEVLVQGKQIPAVTELLLGRGIPKKWIEATDMTDSKKKTTPR
ncbi:hypothetical protein ONZ45_g11242 [Pleurotus djamor]|nr:hypothetical protein ONZ45_g11242 [Pleurotus djamor]